MVRGAGLERPRDREGHGAARRDVHPGAAHATRLLGFQLTPRRARTQIWERRTPNGKWDDLIKVDPPKAHKAKTGGAPQPNGKKAEKPAAPAK